jgi:hypothetical protein
MSYILTWVDSTDMSDHFTHFESPDDAHKSFQELLSDDGIYSASICAVMYSTDYDRSKELKL